jgi:two-component system chemotaxis response regulator CheV
VLIVDDSTIARKQIKRCVESVGAETTVLNDGRQALDYLKAIADSGERASDKIMMMISDIEMPEMDGYTLTAEIRADSRLSDLYVLLHTSLSGVFNQAMVKKVGANEFLPKFNPDLLAAMVAQRVREVDGENKA